MAGPHGRRGAGRGAQRAVSGLPLSGYGPLVPSRLPRMSAAGVLATDGHDARTTSPAPAAAALPAEPKVSQPVVFARGIPLRIPASLAQGQAGMPRLWSLACDIAVENVLDSLNRASVKRPADLGAPERLCSTSPRRAGWWPLPRRTGGWRARPPAFCASWSGNSCADDHRLWPKDAPEQPQQMPTPAAPEDAGRRSVSGCRPSWTCGTRKPVTVPMP